MYFIISLLIIFINNLISQNIDRIQLEMANIYYVYQILFILIIILQI